MEGSGLYLGLPHLLQGRQVSDCCSPRSQPGSAVDLGLVGLAEPESLPRSRSLFGLPDSMGEPVLLNVPVCTKTQTSRCCLLCYCQHSHRVLKGTEDPNCPSGGRTLLEGIGAKATWGTRMDSARQAT